MSDATALRIAIDLMHMPSRVRVVRSQPLPAGVHELLCIAAGEDDLQSAAMAWTGRSSEVLQKAAGFFIEQVLLCPNADSYRVLGASSKATNAELRRNMALLMRWLHPDIDHEGRRSMFASKVTLAWNDLKTPERRASYDREKSPSHATKTMPVKSSRFSSEAGLARPHRFARGRRTARIHAYEKQGLLRRIAAWMGAWAQLHSR
jgi:hypothetical protein